jgi:hypothetical protein
VIGELSWSPDEKRKKKTSIKMGKKKKNKQVVFQKLQELHLEKVVTLA